MFTTFLLDCRYMKGDTRLLEVMNIDEWFLPPSDVNPRVGLMTNTKKTLPRPGGPMVVMGA